MAAVATTRTTIRAMRVCMGDPLGCGGRADEKLQCNSWTAAPVVDASGAPHQSQQLLLQRRRVEQDDLLAIQQRLQRLVDLALAALAHYVGDAEVLEVAAEGLARVRVAGHRCDAVLAQQR